MRTSTTMTTSAEADGIEHNTMLMDCMYVQCADSFIRAVVLVEKHVAPFNRHDDGTAKEQSIVESAQQQKALRITQRRSASTL